MTEDAANERTRNSDRDACVTQYAHSQGRGSNEKWGGQLRSLFRNRMLDLSFFCCCALPFAICESTSTHFRPTLRPCLTPVYFTHSHTQVFMRAQEEEEEEVTANDKQSVGASFSSTARHGHRAPKMGQ